MSTLHTINRSPFERRSLESCLRVLLPGNAILLYEDAIYAAATGTAVEPDVRSAMHKARIYCLEPDLLARGLDASNLLNGVELVSYEGFVALAAGHERVQAWL